MGGGQGSLVVEYSGLVIASRVRFPPWKLDTWGLLIYRLEYLLSHQTALLIMCGLHELFPSLFDCNLIIYGNECVADDVLIRNKPRALKNIVSTRLGESPNVNVLKMYVIMIINCKIVIVKCNCIENKNGPIAPVEYYRR